MRVFGARNGQRGVSIVEMLVTMTILLLAMSGLATILVHNSKINKSQQMSSEVQSNARTCMAMITQRLRTAGWDPQNTGLSIVTLDPNTTDDISQIEVFADLDEDGSTDSDDEQVLIRHNNGVVEWRRNGNVATPFVTLATNISNDSDGDGTIEMMFTPDSTVDPTRITVAITAQSPSIDPVSGDFIRYSIISEVVLRNAL